MQPYSDPITWISFQVDLTKAPADFWLDLGELVAGVRSLDQSALAIVEGRTLVRDLNAQAIQARFAMDGLVIPITIIKQLLLEGMIEVGAFPFGNELSTYLDAADRLRATHPKGSRSFEEAQFLQHIHALVCAGNAGPGTLEWRSTPVAGKPWEGVPDEVIAPFVEDLMDWMGCADLAAPDPNKDAPYQVIRSLLAELYLAWIRPFSTGHNRVMSLFGEFILQGPSDMYRSGQLLSIALYKSGHHFSEQLGAAAAAGDPLPFLAFCVHAMLEELRSLQLRIRKLQQRALWRAQLLDLFQEGNDAPTRRQRQILLDLAEANEPVPLNRLDSLTPALAALYAGVSEKTMRRDMDALLRADLIHRGPKGLFVDLGDLLVFKR